MLTSRSLKLIPLIVVTAGTSHSVLAQVEPFDGSPTPGLNQVDLNAPNSATSRPILPEGAFIAGQEGTVVQTPSGDKLFVYLPDEGSEPVALLMVPCLELERLEQAAIESGDVAPIFMVTGQILSYHRRNYLLPTAWTQFRPDRTRSANELEQNTNTNPPKALLSDDADIQALIDELEQSRNDSQASLRRGERLWLAPKQASESDEDDLGSLSDGDLVSRRTGRFVRQGVVWVVSFDNGTASDETEDVPLIVLPCLNHEKLERLAGRRADEFTIQVSGRVFLYKGRFYLLPSVFQVVPETDLRPIP